MPQSFEFQSEIISRFSPFLDRNGFIVLRTAVDNEHFGNEVVICSSPRLRMEAGSSLPILRSTVNKFITGHAGSVLKRNDSNRGSAVNVVRKRMAKKQQMRWSEEQPA